jgi:hypothetical protein
MYCIRKHLAIVIAEAAGASSAGSGLDYSESRDGEITVEEKTKDTH